MIPYESAVFSRACRSRSLWIVLRQGTEKGLYRRHQGLCLHTGDSSEALSRRRGRSPASQSFDRDFLSLNSGPLNLKEARADYADLDCLLLRGRVKPDLEEV